jgi:phosphoglycerol transferase
MPTTTRTQREWLYYVAAVALSIGVLSLLFQPWKIDLRVPIVYGGDSLVHLGWIKNIVETGWFAANDRWGYPGGQDLRDFPSADALHHLTFRFLAFFTSDVGLLFNLFYFLTFPLTACSALFVLRRLGVSGPVAVAAGLLYTFQPFHLYRTGHLLLTAIYLVPFACLFALRLFQDRPLLVHESDERDERCWEVLVAAALAAAIGGSGAYYAFFTGFFLMVGGLAGACAARRWRPIVRAGGLSGIVFLGFIASTAAAMAHRLNEPNADVPARTPGDAEIYGLKVVQMLMPVYGHRVGTLRNLEESYRASAPLHTENASSALGILGSIGLLYLLGRALLVRGGTGRTTMDGLSILALAGVLLGTVGGFGSAFAVAVSPWIRAYNRISVFIALFALAASAQLLDGVCQRWPLPRRFKPGLVGAVALVLGGLGLLDQTHRRLFPAANGYAESYRIDADFARELESRLPERSAILQLPVCSYPEMILPLDGRIFDGYEHLRLQLHSKSLRWSYGSLRGHSGYLWSCRLARLGREQQWIALVDAGFRGVCVDRTGYRNMGVDFLREVQADLGPPLVVSADQRLHYFDLSAFAARLQSPADEVERERRHDLALNPALVFFRAGFFEEQIHPLSKEPFRWGRGSAEFEVRNDSRWQQTVRLRWYVEVPAFPNREFALRIQSDILNETLPVGLTPRYFERTIAVPPGRHRVRITCDAPIQPHWQEPLKPGIVFRLSHFHCEDVLSAADELRLCEESARIRRQRMEKE